MEGRLETTAVSVHAFAHVTDRYALLRHGGSFGDGYGPMVIAREALHLRDLESTTIAVPGELTSAFLELNLLWKKTFGPDASPQHVVVPFDEILPAVKAGRFDAGLIIHEGQLTYSREGLSLVVDLGAWWKEKTGLPLPLGVNVVRKDLGPELMQEISRCMRESIEAGLKHREEALQYALQFARGMDLGTSDRFVGMYVNERTRDMGEEGVRAIRLLLSEGARHGLVPNVPVEVVD